MNRKVLIVEDNPEIASLIEMHLSDIECEATIQSDGLAGLEQFKKESFDLVILDIMLPSMDGLAVCRGIRSISSTVPVLMLTSKSTEIDRVVGLEMGADDYLVKPFSIPELLARIKALLRRVDAMKSSGAASENNETTEVIEHHNLHIDIKRHAVTLKGKPIDLTAREFELLVYFARHPGQVFSRLQLLEKVWGYDHDGYEHTVNTHINRLRNKIEENPSNPTCIQTVWGVGYKYADS